MTTSMFSINSRYDICLSMTWLPDHPHRISGHVFEIIEYFVLLANRLNVCILFGDTFTEWSDFKQVIESKYELDSDMISLIERSTYYVSRPKYIKGRNILFVDGDLHRLKTQGTKIVFDNIFAFKCSKYDTLFDVPYDVIVLQDDRVYAQCNPEDTEMSIYYKKKIYFDILKKVTPRRPNQALLYATINCRNISSNILDEIIAAYDFDSYLIITENVERYTGKRKIVTMKPPVPDLFHRFSTFIYTPLTGMFDGSPRLPAECKYYGLETTYYNITDEYLKHDTGLYWRMHDIENDFSSLFLTDNDTIFEILNTYI